MPMPPNDASGHLTAQPDSRPQVSSPPPSSKSSLHSVRGLHRIPTANASLYQPVAGRTWWWISLRCPHCRGVHLARVREEADADGPRRAGCGRLVRVRVRTVYRIPGGDS